MLIGFDATNMLGHGGIKTYARELIRALSLEYSDDVFQLLTTASRSRRARLDQLFEGLPNITVRGFMPHVRMLGPGLSPLTAMIGRLSWMRESRRLDLVHLTDPYGAPALPGRFVCTIHDLFPLTRDEYTGTPLRRRYGRRTRAILKGCLAVVTPSGYVREQLKSLFPETRCPVTVVPEAASPYFRPVNVDPASLSGYGLTSEGYFMYVGRLDPRKNVQRLVDAWEALPQRFRRERRLVLVVSGAAPGGSLDALEGIEGVIVIRDVPESDLRTLYSSALALVFPSLDEGFGLPVLEAMRCGCPVITSRASCLPETAGSAALLADPADTASISDGMRKMAESEERRMEYSAAGLQRASEFSWQRTARETMRVYRKALDL